MYFPRDTLAGPIFIFFLDLTYLMANSITITATTNKIIIPTKSPLQRIFWSRVFESLHMQVNELLSVSQGSVDLPIFALAKRGNVH